MNLISSAPAVIIYEMKTNEMTPGQLVPLTPSRSETINIPSTENAPVSTQTLNQFSYPGHRIVDAIKAIKQAWQL